MEYLALIYGDEAAWDALDEDARARMYEGYREFSEAARAAGVLVDGHELGPVTAATTVRVRDGREIVSDGPYAETKEALGGYYVLECASLDDAIEWAARIPAAEHGAVEVRAVHVDPEEAS